MERCLDRRSRQFLSCGMLANACDFKGEKKAFDPSPWFPVHHEVQENILCFIIIIRPRLVHPKPFFFSSHSHQILRHMYGVNVIKNQNKLHNLPVNRKLNICTQNQKKNRN